MELDLLRQRVKVRMEKQPEVLQSFANAEIAVLRNGKAKKTDPPIPEDLAPISGAGRRIRKEREDGRMFLDPIKFRYSEETVVEEPEQVKEPEVQEAAEPKTGRNNRRNRRQKHQEAGKQETKPEVKAEKPKAEPKAEKPKPKAEPKAEVQEGAEAENNKKRRRHYPYRRKPKNGADKTNG